MRFRLESGERRRLWALAGLAFVVLAPSGQAPGSPRNDIHVRKQSREVTPGRANPPMGSLREIRDVHTGTRWLIVRDIHNPAGPGLLMVANESDTLTVDAAARKNPASFLVHAGDRLLIEEHSTAADSYLEAVALEGAELGCTFSARLKLGGRVVTVRAIERGKAAFARPQKGQR